MKQPCVMKKMFVVFVMAFIFLGLLTTKADAKTNIKVTAPSGKVVKVARNKKIKLKTYVKGLKDKEVTYKSNNPSIARVTANGVVKGKKSGKTKIVVTSKTNATVKKTIKVIVYKKAVKKIKLNTYSKTISEGQKFKLKAQILPKKKVSKNLKFSTSNKKVAKVSKKGVIKAVGCGTAKIEVKSTDGSNKKVTCTVNVVKPGIKKLSIRSNKSLNVELTGPKKLEIEDFKVYSKYLSDTKYLVQAGVLDVHTEDEIHYEVVLAEKLVYSTFVKLQINKLSGVKEKEIVCEKSNVDPSIAAIKKNNTIDYHFIRRVGTQCEYHICCDSDWNDIDEPVKVTASNLPEGLEITDYDDVGTNIIISGTHSKVLNEHKSVVTVTDSKGDKLVYNVYFNVIDKDPVIVETHDVIAVAYTPNAKEGLAGSKEITISQNIGHSYSLNDEYYFTYKDFKAEGLPENLRIINDNDLRTGNLEVIDLNKPVKPGVYNIKISGVTSKSGVEFSFKFKLTLVEGIVISGRVTDEFGKPISEDYVEFTMSNEVYSGCYYSNLVYVDKNGNYSIRIIPGVYNIYSKFYTSYINEFKKNQEYNLKSNFYKVDFEMKNWKPLSDNEIISQINNFKILNNDSRVSFYSEHICSEDKKTFKYSAYLRKGVNYTITSGNSYSWLFSLEEEQNNVSTYYAIKGQKFEFACTGQKKIGLDYEIF